MLIHALLEKLDHIAPLACAESWDNVGLLLGDASAEASRIMLAIDATPSVLAEAIALKTDVLVAYHPPLFKAVKRIVAPDPLFTAAQAGLALFSPHTALDAALGGTNDVLADAAGLTARTPLKPSSTSAQARIKLIFFAPKSDVPTVLEALFAAGAGRIGAYTRCSYQTEGEGSFYASANAHPVHGVQNEQTHLAEQRVEVMLDKSHLAGVVEALQAHHPYETPAYDLVPLVSAPYAAEMGQGRIGALAGQAVCTAQALANRLSTRLNAGHAMLACPRDRPADRPLRMVAVQAGAGDSMLDAAIAQGAEVFVTGELRHHTVLSALARGVCVITLTHDQSERAALLPYAAALRLAAPELDVRISQEDRTPWERL